MGHDSRNDLGAACALIYIEHIYFEAPVLECPSLRCSIEQGRAVFPTDTLLHHALVAAAVPWLSSKILATYGFQCRQEAIDSSSEGFEASLAKSSSPEQNSFERTQALLLMAFALSQSSSCAVGRKQAKWLRLAITNLHYMSPSSAGQTRNSRTWKRLWWFGFVMEQLHFLRYSLEQSTPLYPTRFALDPRSMEPLLLEDFDLAPSTTSGNRYQVSEYWTRMRQASCFIKRAALCGCVARYVRNRQCKPSTLPRPSNPSQIHHDGKFWEIQAIAQYFTNLKQDAGIDSQCKYIRETEDLRLIAMRARLEMVFFRIMIALYRGVEKPPDANQGCSGSSSIFYRLRDEQIAHMARRVLITSRKLLDGAGSARTGLGAAGTGVLRAVSIATEALLLLKTWPLDRQLLVRESHALLKICSDESHALWAETVVGDAATPRDAPLLTHDHDLAEVATPRSDSAKTPRDDTTQRYGLVEGSDLLEQKRLFSDFDDMWNMTGIKCEYTGLVGESTP
ncbi:hypothetical protein EDB81DRAFT_774049 [Dactylonectria macrodidyma]|uniref:Transcription factor domain-containing protein n=1 Tax=Dactylonectria macrodidyma TaxID=307937 RepID=A0A9P9FNT2_9HYPO|nr:hypothetical protein EDB81DRAFT_774049 [Dactylonectria macrodidyma]